MNKKTLKKISYFFKSLFSGIIGSAIFFLLAIMTFAITKLFFIIINRDLIISKYNMSAVFAIFLIFGFIYGINCFVKKNYFKHFFKPTWITLLIDAVLSGVIGFCIYIFLKNYIKLAIGIKEFFIIFVFFFVLNYVFSTSLVRVFEIITKAKKKTKFKKTAWTLAILFNPIFILGYLILFSLVIYNSIYVPCNVVILGVENNQYTAELQDLDIKQGEILISLDGNKINSLQNVKDYINSLDVTKEIQMETNKKIYFIQTYKTSDGERHLGLTLAQNICKKDY